MQNVVTIAQSKQKITCVRDAIVGRLRRMEWRNSLRIQGAVNDCAIDNLITDEAFTTRDMLEIIKPRIMN